MVDSGYAAQNKLSTGGTIDVGGTNFRIIGIVSVPQGGSPPDVYIPLAKAQSIGKNGSKSLAGEVEHDLRDRPRARPTSRRCRRRSARLLPSATVTDSSDLASEVTGSLASASSLANNLGKWLSVAVLIAAFLLASLLTMAAVARRVREFGTLKALGWRSRRIVGQVMGESIAIGIVGGASRRGPRVRGTALIDKLAPPLSATVGSSSPASAPGPGRAPGLRHACSRH